MSRVLEKPIDKFLYSDYNSAMEKRNGLALGVQQFRLPRYQELPNVGLYLEQTTKYINGYLAPLGCLEITASMISNYVKKGLIPNPIKKQYYAEHLAYLFFVAAAKQLVSIENLVLLVQLQKDTYTLPVAYDYFCDELEDMIFYVFGLKDTIGAFGETTSEAKSLLHGLIYSTAHMIYMNAQFAAIREKHFQT